LNTADFNNFKEQVLRNAWTIRGKLVVSLLVLHAFPLLRPLPTKMCRATTNRSVRFIVPHTPGAINDFVARLVAQNSRRRGASRWLSITDPAAERRSGYRSGGQASPDGYPCRLCPPRCHQRITVCQAAYDTVRDFAAVTQTALAASDGVQSATAGKKGWDIVALA
jgi:tripartite-type tricarboxylate transporter receptor subunit TctC